MRQDFLDPFFVALGWDVYNRDGIHENYRDVILEQALRVEKSVKAPDYCIRIGPVPKFFVEGSRRTVALVGLDAAVVDRELFEVRENRRQAIISPDEVLPVRALGGDGEKASASCRPPPAC